MKAVIVDIEGSYAVALDKKGDFIRIKNNGSFQIGYEVEVPKATAFNFNAFTKVASIAAVVLLVVGLSAGTFAYTRPYSYVDIDINPSIEITSNIFDRIIKVEALNDDAEKVLNEKSFTNIDINEGIEGILEAAIDKGYLVNSSTSAVVLSVSSKSDDKVKKIQEEIQSIVPQELEKSGAAEAEIVVEKVPIERRDEAKTQGISPGKMLLIEKLKKVDPDVKIEEYKSAPVKEIMKEIKDGRKKSRQDNAQGNDKKQNKDNKQQKDTNQEKDNKDKNVKPIDNDKQKQGNNVQKTDKNKGNDKQTGKRVEKKEQDKQDEKEKGDRIKPGKEQEDGKKSPLLEGKRGDVAKESGGKADIDKDKEGKDKKGNNSNGKGRSTAKDSEKERD